MIEDLVGRRFGRLIVIELTKERRSGQRVWRCTCDCGGEKLTVTKRLLAGLCESCDCLRRELAGGKPRHGMSHSIEYMTWAAIKSRCLNPRTKAWVHYGGRGITVCQEWIDSFEAFYEYVGTRPSSKHSIGRIDNEKGYEPGNVKWQTRIEQRRNQRPPQRSPQRRPKGKNWIWRGKWRPS